jgi:alpha-tubulin suppressor-like RCC1 family protein
VREGGRRKTIFALATFIGSLAATSLPAFAGTPPAVYGNSVAPGDSSAQVAWGIDFFSDNSTSFVITVQHGAVTDPPRTVPKSAACTGPEECYYYVTGLQNWTRYTFTVAGQNASGTGPASVPQTAVPRPGPPARDLHQLAYDSKVGGVVMYGGLSSAYYGLPVYSDTWIYSQNQWKLFPTGHHPQENWQYGMAYDATTQQLVLFGGCCNSLGEWTGETWVFDGTDWTLQHPLHSPPARGWAEMVYDAATSSIVLFGGQNELGTSAECPYSYFNGPEHYCNDTWTWNGVDWTEQSPATRPGARTQGSFAYDSTHGTVVLFGGCAFGSCASPDNSQMTWTWDGTNWTPHYAGVLPPDEAESSMSDFPPGSGVVLEDHRNPLPNTYTQTTWVWDGVTWSQVFPAMQMPLNFDYSMTYDPDIKKALVFGGDNTNAYNITWLWDGNTWTDAALGSPCGGPACGWGANGSGQVGDGTTQQRVTPAPLASTNPALTQIAAGYDFAIGLDSTGAVYTWGANAQGQLGDGTTTPHSTPRALPGLTGVLGVAAGCDGNGYAIRSDHTVVAWGPNTFGQIGDGSGLNRLTPVAVPGLANDTKIVAGCDFVLAMKGDGSVVGWGYNGDGELGDGTTTNRATPIVLPGVSNVVDIAAGWHHGLAAQSDGSVMTWGLNDSGQLGDGTTSERISPVVAMAAPQSLLGGVTSVAAGEHHSLALTSLGNVYAWGANDHGQVGDGTNTQRTQPTLTDASNGARQIAAGEVSSFAITSAGTLQAWGGDAASQLGDGTTTDSLVPITPYGLPGSVGRVASEHMTTYAIVGQPPSGSSNLPPAQGSTLTVTVTNGTSLSAVPGSPVGLMYSPGPTFSITATVQNTSATTTALGTVATLALTQPLQLAASDTPSHFLGSLPPGGSATTTWTVTTPPPQAPGGTSSWDIGVTSSTISPATMYSGQTTIPDLRQVVFVHGIGGNAADYEAHYALPYPKQTWQKLAVPMENQYGAGFKIWSMWQDRAYAMPNSDPDHTAYPPCDPSKMPPADQDIGSLPPNTPSLSVNSCDSQSEFAYSAAQLDDDLSAYNQPIALIANSQGGAITRGWLALAQLRDLKGSGGSDVGFHNVDTIFFLQGAQQGSWLAGTDQILAHDPGGGAKLEQDIIQPDVLYSTFNLNTARPAIANDLPPQSEWYDSVNLNPVPSRIHYFNIYTDMQFRTHLTFLGHDLVSGQLDMGDLILRPGKDDPQATPVGGGARFLPGGVNTVDRHEWELFRPYDITFAIAGSGGVTPGPPLNEPANHINFGDNLYADNTYDISQGPIMLPNCQYGPSSTQPSQLTPIQMILAVLQNPAQGCAQR